MVTVICINLATFRLNMVRFLQFFQKMEFGKYLKTLYITKNLVYYY
jgi:hypothetical protein